VPITGLSKSIYIEHPDTDTSTKEERSNKRVRINGPLAHFSAMIIKYRDSLVALPKLGLGMSMLMATVEV
jgi:hypothetical protein